jgi:hypothetical protein
MKESVLSGEKYKSVKFYLIGTNGSKQEVDAERNKQTDCQICLFRHVAHSGWHNPFMKTKRM